MVRNVCVVVASRANYGRVKSLMAAIKDHEQLHLQLVVAASTLLDRFGRAVDIIKADGFEPDRSIHYLIEGENLITQAKSTGLGIVELSSVFSDLKPDMVVTVADRYETMATAIASTYMNIPLVHIQGGEVSGNIDDRVRHAITKMADYHFPCTKQSALRINRMGENENTIFNYGCPAMDLISKDSYSVNRVELERYSGVGDKIDWSKPYILMVQHPVTTSYGDGLSQINETLDALKKFEGIQKVVLWPNGDAGTDDISKGIRVFRENKLANGFHFFKNFSAEDYVSILANSLCCVGNSSSFIREGSFLGVPSVIVGDRQRDRECGKNVQFVAYNKQEIVEAITSQINVGRYDRSSLFGYGDAGYKIAEELTKIDLKYQKSINY
ncbi:UDP-N-acetylglucosamine 2-epimerase [Marinomonas sp. PE14-40]|uniref:UDP-N-acetylglucosamine 2-epimerase n=1 Tax=Marinomonas sp. PE14-40 TaxID=3060621 RepID=UPI003F674F3F